MNQLELVPCEDGLTAVVTKPDGEVTMEHMSWEQFKRLRKACEESTGPRHSLRAA